MPLNTRLSTTARNTQLDALAVLANTGHIRIYDGVQPATPDTAIAAQVLLAELRFGASAFGASAAGVITANAITDDSSANATGTAAWFRVLQSNGTVALWDGSAGTSGSNLNMNSVAIQVGAAVGISSMTHSLPMQEV